jgi:hypothetical protein
MTYLKSFEMFESQLSENQESFEAVNEAAIETMAKVLPADVKKAVKKMTKEEATAAATEIAKKLKLKVSDLTNPEKVVLAMAKQSAVMESESNDDEDDAVNEGLTDWLKSLKAKKAKIGEWMQKGGLATTAGGILLTALNTPEQYIPSNVTVEPNMWATFGLAAVAIGFIAAVSGAKMQGTLGADAASAATAIHR